MFPGLLRASHDASVLGGPACRVQELEENPGMEKPIRKAELHVNVQLGEEDDNAHLLAVYNLRLETAQATSLWLLFDTEPSLRTARKQEAMHRQAHAWAQAPGTLRSIEMPSIVADLVDAQESKSEAVQWYLRVEMPGYGRYSYRVQPLFEASAVTFAVRECLPD